MQATTIRIPAGLVERLREAAKADGRSMNNLINKALSDFVKIGNAEAYSHPSHKPFPKTSNISHTDISDEQKEAAREMLRKMSDIL